MLIIEILLAVSALYSAVVWLLTALQVARGGIEVSGDIEEHTFHLGLCFILSLGFLGMMIGA